VQVVMARLKENGMTDDAKYAKQFARQRTQIRKQGKFRVARDLRARGIPDRHISSALEEVAQTSDEAAMVRPSASSASSALTTAKWMKRKWLPSTAASSAPGSADVVRREIARRHREDVPEVGSRSKCGSLLPLFSFQGSHFRLCKSRTTKVASS